MPSEDVVRRYYRSKTNFWRVYIERVDRWYLFYNAGENFQEVAVGEDDVYELTDKRLFELFLQNVSGSDHG